MFKGDLVLKHIKGSKELWKVYAPFSYTTDDGRSFTVPEGFLTDLATVPQILRSLISSVGRYDEAAVLHDFLYTHHQTSRKEADYIFLNAMEGLGVVLWKRVAMFLAVRAFGGILWYKKRSVWL